MKTEAVLDDIRCRVEAGYPLLFLKTAEEDRWERELAELALEMERGLVTWTITCGLRPPVSGSNQESPSALRLLADMTEYPDDHLFLVKDFHPYLTDPVGTPQDANKQERHRFGRLRAGEQLPALL